MTNEVAILTEPVMVPACAWCKRVLAGGEYRAGHVTLLGGVMVATGAALALMPGWYEFTHGICVECAAKWMPTSYRGQGRLREPEAAEVAA